VRILLDATTEVGLRAGKVLLAEPEVEWIGLWNEPTAELQVRSGPASEITGYDVAVTDRIDHLGPFIARCSVAEVPVVVWHDAANVARGGAAVPVVVGANVGSGLADILIHHPAGLPGDDDTVEIAWTEPGSPLRSGEAFAFPEPIGMSWARRRSPGRYVAFRDDEWSGAVLRVSGPSGERIVGVADHGAYLEALVLASAALCAAEGAYPTGVVTAASAGERLMNKVESVELDFAVWRSHS
jgi:hypothetical protein